MGILNKIGRNTFNMEKEKKNLSVFMTYSKLNKISVPILFTCNSMKGLEQVFEYWPYHRELSVK